MNIFDPYTHATLTQLSKAGVKYIVVGGYAVNYYGYRRTTGDIDLWIAPENGENKARLLAALAELGIDKDGIALVNGLDFTGPILFSDGEEPFKIDFMTRIDGVEFHSAWERSQEEVIDGIALRFIHLKDLIVNKMTSNRNRDKDDVETLQKIQQLKG